MNHSGDFLATLRDTLRLYGVVGRDALRADVTLPDAVRQALDGGVTFLQLREKHARAGELRALVETLLPECRRRGVPLVVNDCLEAAVESDADGLHIGQSDATVREAREALGPRKLLGVSAQTVRQALDAQRDGADYLGVGAVFPTATKQDAEVVTLDELRAICRSVRIPVVAIGGITPENVGVLWSAGIAGVAVVSAIFSRPDITLAARRFPGT